MASACLALRTTVSVRDAMLAVRMMEESMAAKCATEPVLLLGKHMTDMVTAPDLDGHVASFDEYVGILVENFTPRAAQSQE